MPEDIINTTSKPDFINTVKLEITKRVNDAKTREETQGLDMQTESSRWLDEKRSESILYAESNSGVDSEVPSLDNFISLSDEDKKVRIKTLLTEASNKIKREMTKEGVLNIINNI